MALELDVRLRPSSSTRSAVPSTCCHAHACAPRSTPRSASTTTPCACCGPPGSSPGTGSSPTRARRRRVASMAARLQIVSAERIRDELDKLMVVDHPSAGLFFCIDTGLCRRSSCPSCRRCGWSRTRSTATRTCSPTPSRWSRTSDGPVRNRPANHPDRTTSVCTRLAALFHDVGKPRTRGFASGQGRRPSTTTRWWERG